MSNRLSDFESRIKYRFKDADLLECAVTHASYGDGRSKALMNNERLEFLGDRILGLLAAECLYMRFPGLDEGGLAHRLNSLVNKEACANAARRCGLGEALRLSPSEERVGGREKVSILGDACEAVMGALYLDGGLDPARDFFNAFWSEEIEGMTRRPKDAKSRLQEWAAKKGYGPPVYKMLEVKGPDHRPIFEVEVQIDGLEPGYGDGGSKQSAQRAAAENLLERENADE